MGCVFCCPPFPNIQNNVNSELDEESYFSFSKCPYFNRGNDCPIQYNYLWEHSIRGGQYGSSMHIRSKERPDNKYILKILPKIGLRSMNYSWEIIEKIAKMQKFECVNLNKIIDFCDNDENIFVVYEYAKEGNIWNFIDKNKDSIDTYWGFIIHSWINALDYWEERGWEHGNWIGENILVFKPDDTCDETPVKVISEDVTIKWTDYSIAPYFINKNDLTSVHYFGNSDYRCLYKLIIDILQKTRDWNENLLNQNETYQRLLSAWDDNLTTKEKLFSWFPRS